VTAVQTLTVPLAAEQGSIDSALVSRCSAYTVRANVFLRQFLGNKKDTGEPVDLDYVREVPISTLTPYES